MAREPDGLTEREYLLRHYSPAFSRRAFIVGAMGADGTYRACAFVPETGALVHSGALRITLDRVEFEDGSVKGSLPLQGIRVRHGGHNDEQLFFEHPEFPGWSIYSSDERLAADPVLRSSFAGQLHGLEKARRRKPLPVVIGIGFLLFLLAGLIVLWLSKDRLVEYIADKIPIAWEETLGDQVYQQVAREGRVLSESRWDASLQEITNRLLQPVQNSGFRFRFHILADTNVNAFALPGGNVVILTGLLEKAESPEEVAGVLAHELAHVTRRHSLRNMIKSAGLILMLQAAFGDASGLLAASVEGSRFLLQQKFSRDFEREADDTGWTYLLAAQINPRGMIHFFERLNQAAQVAPEVESSLALLSTHPATEERVERLEAKWNALPSHSGFVTLGAWPGNP